MTLAGAGAPVHGPWPVARGPWGIIGAVPAPDQPRRAADPFGLQAPDLAELRRRGSYKWTRHPPDVLPAFVAEMDLPVAEPVRAAVIAAVAAGDLGYAPLATDVGLDDVVARWLGERFGWRVRPEAVLVVADVMRGVEASIAAFTRPGDAVVVQTPVYPPFLAAVTDAGRVLVENPLQVRDGRVTFDLDGLAGALDRGARLVLVCHPQNPTGRVFDRHELAAVAELAGAAGAVVVSDEVHAPLCYGPEPFTPMASVSEAAAARTVTVTAASKAWNFAGLKCGVVVAPAPELRERLAALPQRTRSGYGRLGVVATMAALSAGAPWLAAVVEHLDANRRLLAELLAARLPGVGYRVPEATYLAWLDCRPLGLGPDPCGFFLERARVALSDGTLFGSPGRGWVRLNFATSADILTEIVQRMALATGGRGAAARNLGA